METWIYLPNGCKVKFEINPDEDAHVAADCDYTTALAYTNRLLALGASVNAPGLEAGEEKSDIGFIARWLKNDNDGGTSNRVDLYVNHPKMTSRYMSLYVKNTPESNAEFERITGVNLNRVNMLPTKAPMNKEEDRSGCIVALPKPLVAIWKHNPDYKEGVLDGEPARLFVRWESVGTPTQPPTPQPAPETAKTGANSSAAPAVATGTPKTPENAGNDNLPNWFNTPLQTCWGVFKTYILKEVYGGNTFQMNGSLKKHSISDGKFIGKEWATKTAGEVLEYLKHRNDEPTDNPELLPESA